MPGLDRTGPEGKGSRTGRNRGRCNPENERNERWSGLGLGRGLGRRGRQGGRGLGRRSED